jgi:hypothetical protein
MKDSTYEIPGLTTEDLPNVRSNHQRNLRGTETRGIPTSSPVPIDAETIFSFEIIFLMHFAYSRGRNSKFLLLLLLLLLLLDVIYVNTRAAAATD